MNSASCPHKSYERDGEGANELLINNQCMRTRGNYSTCFVCVCVLVTSLALAHEVYTTK